MLFYVMLIVNLSQNMANMSTVSPDTTARNSRSQLSCKLTM